MKNPASTLLLVDDNPHNLVLLEQMLAPEKYVLKKANTGEAAWELLDSGAPVSVVLLDRMMPGMGGMGLLKKLREDERFANLQVIMQTSLDGVSHEVAASSAGANRYLTKPVDRKLLLASVEACLRDHRRMEYLETEARAQGVRARLFEQFLLALERNAQGTTPMQLLSNMRQIMRESLEIEGDPIIRLSEEGCGKGIFDEETEVLVCFEPYQAVLPIEATEEQQVGTYKMLALMSKHLDAKFHQAQAEKARLQLQQVISRAGQQTLDLIKEIDEKGDEMTREQLFQKMKLNVLEMLVTAGHDELFEEWSRLRMGAMTGQTDAADQGKIDDLLASFGM